MTYMLLQLFVKQTAPAHDIASLPTTASALILATVVRTVRHVRLSFLCIVSFPLLNAMTSDTYWNLLVMETIWRVKVLRCFSLESSPHF